ncbi:hypothetical protein BQ8420_14820 [Nocardiopsis sp. JB363]|nr:hypothetical protein BQ8420_14820 [Nocardiopsis sp. JB363]
MDAFRDTDDGELVSMTVVDSHGEIDSGDEPGSWEPVLMTVTASSADDAKEAAELWGEVTRFDVVIALVRALAHAGLPLAREGTAPLLSSPGPVRAWWSPPRRTVRWSMIRSSMRVCGCPWMKPP